MSGAICQSNQDLPESMVLGNLLFYSLSDMKVPESDLFNIFTSNNVPVNYIRKISSADAFRRASSSIKNRVVYVKDIITHEQLKLKIEVDEVRSDEEGIKRIIGVKKVDEVSENIQYEPIGEMIFYRDTNGVNCYTTSGMYQNEKVFIDLCDEVENKYNDWSVYHTKDTIRNLVNRIVQDTHPVSLTQSGLCKFIPKSHSDLLYYLKNAILELKPYGISNSAGIAENYMEIIPVIDTEEQRELIKKASETELKDNLFSFTQELKEVLQNRNVLPARTVNTYLNRFSELKAQVDDYESLLGNYLGYLRTQITESTKLIHDNSEVDTLQEVDEKPIYV